MDLAALLDELTGHAVSNGRGRRWQCPFAEHADEHPSVSMFTDRRGHERWRCWSGDDHRGDAVDLVMAARQVPRRDAVQWLATRTGQAPARSVAQPRRPSPPQPTALDPAVVMYAERCQAMLWSRQGWPVRRWLHNRGLNDDVLRVNRVGADLGRATVPRRRGLPAPVGLAATFPALNCAGEVVYVQTRALTPGAGPKYSNPAARLGLNPRVAWVRPPAPRPPGRLVVCEGIPDALVAAQAGFASLAVMGTATIDDTVARQVTDAARGAKVSVIVDADAPGRAAGARLVELLEQRHVAAVIVEPPDGLDLNAWAQTDQRWPVAVTGERSFGVVRDELWAALRSDGPGRTAGGSPVVEQLESELDRVSSLRRPPRRSTDCGGLEL